MSRFELKAQAKSIISLNYWFVVGITALYIAVVTGGSLLFPYFAGAVSFFLMPLYMGLIVAYVSLSDNESVNIGTMFNEGFNGKYYLRRVGGYAWMSLFIFLWSLLFVIPGIVKSYSYAMTPYLLAKYPEIPAKEALTLSMKIMNGRKAELFVLTLSFIGWMILTGMTAGLLGFFYVFPYMLITITLWQKNVMKQVTESGEFVYTAGV